MTSVYKNNNNIIINNGKIGINSNCCCDKVCEGPCPETPDGCTVRVWLEFEGGEQIEYWNGPFEYLSFLPCVWEFLAEDIPEEWCGSVSALFTIGYDESCNVVLKSVVGFPEGTNPEGNPCPIWKYEFQCV